MDVQKKWMDCFQKDMKIVGVKPTDAAERAKWRKRFQWTDPASQQDYREEEE